MSPDIGERIPELTLKEKQSEEKQFIALLKDEKILKLPLREQLIVLLKGVGIKVTIFSAEKEKSNMAENQNSAFLFEKNRLK
ncbi:hypothetical protein KJA15_03350 [Patescibacteria group bacterium]|nr:hypothetical protein [Patescibacteria group bacterium]